MWLLRTCRFPTRSRRRSFRGAASASRNSDRFRGRAPNPCLLTADLRHRPGRAYEAGIGDAVLELLVADGEADVPLELLVRGAGPQRRLQIPLAPREETGPELAVSGQADAVAGGAE